MLVLTRKTGEAIESSGPCKITIVAVDGGKVRIGLKGPSESKFVRCELLDPRHGGKQDDEHG